MRAYKYRIYPNQKQQELIEKHFGCTRFVYNWGLETKIKAYQTDKTTLSYFKLNDQLTSLKTEYEWLKEVDSQSLQMALRNLDNAFTRFFREKKGFPKFRNKHGKQSYQIPQRCEVLVNKIKIPKLGLIKAKIDRQPKGKLGTFTVSKTPTGKYFVSIVSDDIPTKQKTGNGLVGIDLGIKTYATVSDGTEIENPKWLRNNQKRLAVLQRRASRKVKGSENRSKANLKVALLHEKITNQRKDWQHKTTTKLISENQVICLEDLNIAGMVKNHSLAKAISECGWAQFVDFLQYKAEWYGSEIIKIGRFEPSSKICSCGTINHNLKLSDREWTCESCGVVNQRDLLAAQNILKFGLKNTPWGTREVPVESSTIVGAMKQEVQKQDTPSEEIVNIFERSFHDR